MLGFGLLWCFCRQNFHHLPCTSEKWGQRNVGQKHSCHSVGKLKHRTLSISLSYTPRETASFLDISQVKIRRAMTQCCCDEGWFYLTYRNIFSWHFVLITLIAQMEESIYTQQGSRASDAWYKSLFLFEKGSILIRRNTFVKEWKHFPAIYWRQTQY